MLSCRVDEQGYLPLISSKILILYQFWFCHLQFFFFFNLEERMICCYQKS